MQRSMQWSWAKGKDDWITEICVQDMQEWRGKRGGGDYSKDRYKGGIKDIKEWMIGYRCIGHVGLKDRGGGGDYSKDIYKGGSKDIKEWMIGDMCIGHVGVEGGKI